MTQKKFTFYFALIFFFSLSLWYPSAWAEEVELPPIQAKSYILMDGDSGLILAEKNSDQQLPPASMTKMMTEFVIMDLIKQGKLRWDEKVVVSPRAAAINEAQIHLMENDEVTLKELFIAMALQSANDATVALAEHVAGSEEKFVELMNEKAKQLGMKNTHFWNSTGLNKGSYPDPPGGDETHVMSARDSAILAAQLMKAHPEIIEYTSMSKYTFFEGTPRAQSYDNWNKMLKGLEQYYPGVDGFKTGHTNAAGHCFTGTAKRGPLRLVTVVMGTESQTARFVETKKLLDYAFRHYQVETLLSAKESVPNQEHMTLTNGIERKLPVVVKDQIRIPVRKEQKDQYTYRVTYKQDLKAPIEKGTVVGEVQLLYQGKPMDGIKPVPLIAQTDMEKGNWLRLLLRNWSDQVQSIF